jgi:hypothetical protein
LSSQSLHCSYLALTQSSVFANDSSDVVAITAHGGVCLAMQRLLKVPQQLPHTAAVLPFIIKAIPKN